jgi:hypothetical protein
LQDIELARISQEVTIRFYNLLAAGARNGAPLRLVSHVGAPLRATMDEATKRTLYEDYTYSSIPSIGVVALPDASPCCGSPY